MRVTRELIWLTNSHFRSSSSNHVLNLILSSHPKAAESQSCIWARHRIKVIENFCTEFASLSLAPQRMRAAAGASVKNVDGGGGGGTSALQMRRELRTPLHGGERAKAAKIKLLAQSDRILDFMNYFPHHGAHTPCGATTHRTMQN